MDNDPRAVAKPLALHQSEFQNAIVARWSVGRHRSRIEFRGNSISLGVGGNSAFDIDPQGKAGTDKKVPEANFMRFFEIGGLALWAFTLPTRNLDHDPTTLPPRAIARY